MDAQKIQQKIKRGFNSGYVLRTHSPKLAERYAKILTGRKDEYALGFIAGIKEREKELFKARGKNYDIGKIPTKPKHRTKDKDDRDR